MHLKRLVIAVIFIPLLYLYVMKLPVQYSVYLITAIAAVGLYEFYSMFLLENILKYLAILIGAGLMIACFRSPEKLFSLYLVTVLLVLTVRLFMKRDPTLSMVDAATAMLGLAYIPGLLTFQINLAMASQSWLIFLYGAVWAADSAAYYVGKSMGRHKLYEEISPNKTMEGGVGSLLGGVAGGILLKYALNMNLSLVHAAIMGLSIGASTIIGDLVESMFKRDAKVKDSGTIVPGHGGILDKIDGATFAGPALYFVCYALKIIR
ncbi:MAG: phosphatidate cytidylyltransferase [Nitrospirae bacterium]|nr:phosphatidate cytidylyltransferase [Nitrospirota bacterium]